MVELSFSSTVKVALMEKREPYNDFILFMIDIFIIAVFLSPIDAVSLLFLFLIFVMSRLEKSVDNSPIKGLSVNDIVVDF